MTMLMMLFISKFPLTKRIMCVNMYVWPMFSDSLCCTAAGRGGKVKEEPTGPPLCQLVKVQASNFRVACSIIKIQIQSSQITSIFSSTDDDILMYVLNYTKFADKKVLSPTTMWHLRTRYFIADGVVKNQCNKTDWWKSYFPSFGCTTSTTNRSI